MPAASKPSSQVEDISSLPVWAQNLIGELRRENAGHRKAKSEAERMAQQAQEAAAKEQSYWKDLAEQYEPKAKRAEALEKYIAETLEAKLKNVPERLKGVIPAFDDPLRTLQWVQNAEAIGLFNLPSPPETDNRRGDGPARGTSYESKQERAARLGVDPRYLPD